jgi:hypothetical protein
MITVYSYRVVCVCGHVDVSLGCGASCGRAADLVLFFDALSLDGACLSNQSCSH